MVPPMALILSSPSDGTNWSPLTQPRFDFSVTLHLVSSRCSSFHRKSIPRCRRINRMLSNESLHPPAFSRSNSQASVDSSTSVEEFWREIESIKESSVGAQEEQPPTTEVKPVDGKGLDPPCGFPVGEVVSPPIL